MSLLWFHDSFFEVDEITDKKLGKIYFIRQTEPIEDKIEVNIDYTFKEVCEYDAANHNAEYFSCGDGHGFIGFRNKEDAQRAAEFREGLVLAAVLKYKSRKF
jgi:hypothetical protein